MRFSRSGPHELRPYALALLTGVLCALAFPPFGYTPLGWLAFVPLVVAVRRAGSWKQALLCGALAAVAMCAIGYGWIANTAHRFWSVPWPVAALLLLAFSTFGEINFTIFATLLWLLRSRLEKWPAAATAALFVVTESFVVKVFPDALGHTQVDTPALPAAAALVGLPGLSFAVAWFAATLAWYPARVHVARRHRAAEVALCVGVIAALWVYGARRQAAVEAMPTERELELVLVQSNIGDPLAFEQDGLPSMADTVVATYVRMTRQAMLEGPADFVLWPETAVPAGPGDVVFDRIRSLVLEMDTALIFGGYDFEMTESGRWRIFNTLFWMNRSGDLAGRYHKHNLVPLGEHVPFSDRFPFLRDLLPDPGEFSRGPGARVMKMDGVSFTPLICYELLFARYVRRGLRLGGEVLLNVTNDYWFGRYAEPEQHLALARMRAFETGRPIIRATNTGFSALIDATGRVVARTGLWRPEILRVTLQVPRMHQTPYTRWGEWVTVLFVVVAWGAVAILWKLAR